jgi:hypothetical protein
MTTENKLSIFGYIRYIDTLQQGETWKKQEFTIETVEKYPKEVRISCWNNNIEYLSRCKVGDPVNVSFNVQSRQYKENWFTELSAWRIDVDIRAAISAQKGASDDN